MAALRSMWKGVLSFGLVTIPVRLYAATESKDVHLRYLHAPCAAPVQYRKVWVQAPGAGRRGARPFGRPSGRGALTVR